MLFTSPRLSMARAVNLLFLNDISLKGFFGNYVHLNYPGVILHSIIVHKIKNEFGPICIS